MVRRLLGQKKSIRQVWTKTGRRLAVTEVSLAGNVVARIVSTSDEGQRIQVGFGPKKAKNMAKAQRAQLEKVGVQQGKRWFKETTAEQELQAGQDLPVQEVFHVGDVVKISGSIKGRGFAGVMKRHGFAGGPRTHGQSDRGRAPGSIGNRTTPGRVFKGQRMAGHYGNTIETLEDRVIVAINPETQSVWIKGTLPGAVDGLLTLEKQTGQRMVELNVESAQLLNLPAEKPAAPEVAETTEPEVASSTPEEIAPEPQEEVVAAEAESAQSEQENA